MDPVFGPGDVEVSPSIMNTSNSPRASSATALQSQSDSPHSHQGRDRNDGHVIRESPYQNVTSSKRFLEHLQVTIRHSFAQLDFNAASLALALFPVPTSFAVSDSARTSMTDIVWPNDMDRPTEEHLLSTSAIVSDRRTDIRCVVALEAPRISVVGLGQRCIITSEMPAH